MTTAIRKRRASSGDSARGAHAAVDFINALHHTGDFTGVPFALRPWQEKIVRAIFDPSGKARVRKVFVALPRKQGKTELVAAIMLFLMFGTGKRSQRLYSASGDVEQAALVYGAAAEMVRQSAALSACALCYDGYKKIAFEPLGSVYKALSSDAPRKHGLRPSVVVLDELHVFPNRDLYNALMTAFGATIDPLTIMITTAGHDRTSLCFEQWKYARAVRDGEIDDPTFLPILYETDPEEDWTSEEVWHKAMPALGDFCQLEFIREECRRAQQVSAYENTFRQLYLNQWTEQATRWISMVKWERCRTAIDPTSLDGDACYLGFDHGITGDMSFASLVFPQGDGRFKVLGHGWAPRNGKWRDEPRNRDRYLAWARDGYLTLTEGQVVDEDAIEADLVRWCGQYGRFSLRLMLADRAYATRLLNRLFNEHGMNVKGIPQGPVTLNEAMKLFEDSVVAGTIECDNPIIDWNVQNAVVRRNATGLMLLDKEQAAERIDGLSALINALAGAVADPENFGPSVYEQRGILTL